MCANARRIRLRHLLHAALLALSSAIAFAAIPASASAQRQPDRAAATASSVRGELSPADVVREIARTASRVQHVLGDLRRDGSARPARCVDATLSQITATLRLALERTTRAARYERTGQPELAPRERALIVRLRVRTRELEREARHCVEPRAEVGPDRTVVTTIIEPWVPTDAIQDPRTPGRLEAIHGR